MASDFSNALEICHPCRAQLIELQLWRVKPATLPVPRRGNR